MKKLFCLLILLCLTPGDGHGFSGGQLQQFAREVASLSTDDLENLVGTLLKMKSVRRTLSEDEFDQLQEEIKEPHVPTLLAEFWTKKLVKFRPTGREAPTDFMSKIARLSRQKKQRLLKLLEDEEKRRRTEKRNALQGLDPKGRGYDFLVKSAEDKNREIANLRATLDRVESELQEQDEKILNDETLNLPESVARDLERQQKAKRKKFLKDLEGPVEMLVAYFEMIASISDEATEKIKGLGKTQAETILNQLASANSKTSKILEEVKKKIRRKRERIRAADLDRFKDGIKQEAFGKIRRAFQAAQRSVGRYPDDVKGPMEQVIEQGKRAAQQKIEAELDEFTGYVQRRGPPRRAASPRLDRPGAREPQTPRGSVEKEIENFELKLKAKQLEIISNAEKNVKDILDAHRDYLTLTPGSHQDRLETRDLYERLKRVTNPIIEAEATSASRAAREINQKIADLDPGQRRGLPNLDRLVAKFKSETKDQVKKKLAEVMKERRKSELDRRISDAKENYLRILKNIFDANLQNAKRFMEEMITQGRSVRFARVRFYVIHLITDQNIRQLKTEIGRETRRFLQGLSRTMRAKVVSEITEEQADTKENLEAIIEEELGERLLRPGSARRAADVGVLQEAWGKAVGWAKKQAREAREYVLGEKDTRTLIADLTEEFNDDHLAWLQQRITAYPRHVRPRAGGRTITVVYARFMVDRYNQLLARHPRTPIRNLWRQSAEEIYIQIEKDLGRIIDDRLTAFYEKLDKLVQDNPANRTVRRDVEKHIVRRLSRNFQNVAQIMNDATDAEFRQRQAGIGGH